VTTTQLIDTHGRLSDELADALSDRAEVQAAIEVARAGVFDQQYHNGTNITTIREMVAATSAPFSAEAIKLTGRIEALRAQLSHIELRLRHAG